MAARRLLALLAIVAVGASIATIEASPPTPYVKRTSSTRPLSSQLAGHAGSDRSGADMLEAPMRLQRGASAADCAQACIRTKGCVAWSYDPVDGVCDTPHTSSRSPACHLQHTITPVAAHSCRTSGTPYAALLPPAFPKLPASAITPTGWLARQLRVQLEGLAGHLQLFWPDIADSEFIGGTHDSPQFNHERFAYWFRGMVTMGHLTQDADFSTTVYNYTNYILEHQRDDGWLGPSEDYDPWPRMLLLYVFQQYHEINDTDTRVIPAMYKYLDFLWNQYSNTTYDPTSNPWTYMRTEDMQTSIMWLYDNYPQDRQQFLLDLNELLYNKSFDWDDYYRHHLPTTNVTGWNMNDHGVNNGQALKSAAVQYRASHSSSDIDSTYLRMHKMDRYHGQASGMFSCDECLAGLNPSRGTELCTVVETMFSYATMFSVVGDTVFADKVEQITFNALPATLTADMWAHQYLQQSNEVNAKVQVDPWWNSDGGSSVLYGLAPNEGGCCTSNMPQGWPRYATANWMLTQNATSTGILAAFLGPSNVAVTVEDPTYGNNTISITSVTDYPLVPNATVRYVVKAERPFGFAIRIPGWAVDASLVDGAGKQFDVMNGTIYTYEYSSGSAVTLTLSLPYSLRAVRRFNNAISIYYGPLLLALDFSYNTTVLQQYAFNSTDLQYLPIDKWNYAILIDDSNPAAYLNVTAGEGVPSMYPWDPLHPTVRVSAYAREIEWPMKHDSADEPPVSPVKSSAPLQPITLVPYGQTKLRIAEIPTLVR